MTLKAQRGRRRRRIRNAELATNLTLGEIATGLETGKETLCLCLSHSKTS
jgi:hypothetical protein